MSLVETLQQSGQSSWIEIRLDRFRHNLKTLRCHTKAPHILAVVKANAYGHGLVEMARAIQEDVSYLGVSSLLEVLELREHGIQAPVFLFGRLFDSQLATAIKSEITLSVSSFAEALEISRVSQEFHRQTRIHIKMDTGMGRLGIPEHEATNEIRKIASLSHLILEGIYTHFPTAEQNDGFSQDQAERFQLMVRDLETEGIRFALRHCANSAGSFAIQNPVFNMIRPGLVLYGIPPSANHDYQPVLTLKSRILLLKQMSEGESVGYGRTYKIKTPTTIATLAIGYSHGYPFHLSNRAQVLYRGKRYPVAGRVSMDYICVDLGNTTAQIGDEITLIGEDGAEKITARETADWAGTISYEIVTRLSSRLPRFYIGNV